MKKNHTSNSEESNQPVFNSFRKELRTILNARATNPGYQASPIQSSSSRSKINSESDKRHQFRLQAINEILESEKNYLRQIESILDCFVIPLKQTNIIDVAAQTTLFGHIEMIYNLNSELLALLNTDLENVAKAFLKMAPFLKLYSVYAFDYKHAILTLQQLTEKNSKFKSFLIAAESKAQTKLNSLMIAPIQRVPRYKLLLEQVLLYTSPADSDCKILKQSIREIECTVSHIDSAVEDHEATQTLLNLQNSLVDSTPKIIKPGRKVIKEGVLNKVTRNGQLVKRYCILMSDLFMYCKILKERPAYESIENSLECGCIFPLKKSKIYEMFPGNFKISCQGDGVILSTTDSDSAHCWANAIRDAIDVYRNCRKTLRKESSKRKPMRKRNREIKNFYVDAETERKESDVASPDDEDTPGNGVISFLASRIRKFLKRKLSGTTTSTDAQSAIKPTEDPGLGFAGQNFESNSYFRTNSVDNIISPDSNQTSCIGDVSDQDSSETEAAHANPTDDDDMDDCTQNKKRKLNENPFEHSDNQMRMQFNPFYEEPGTSKKTDTIDRYYKEKPFDFSLSGCEKGSLKDRLFQFFASLF